MTHASKDSRGGSARTRRWRRPALYSGLAAAFIALVVVLGGCGDSSSTSTDSSTPNAQSSTSTRQIMATVETGDVTESVMGQLEITTDDSKPQATVTVSSDDADKVAEGQTVMAVVGGFGGSRGSGQPSGQPSPMSTDGSGGDMASPPAQSGEQPSGDMASPPSGGGMGGGQMGGSDMLKNGTEGTVTAVETNDDGTVTATIELSEMPEDAEVGDTGMAVIEVEVLAEDVLVVPTQAIETSDGASTVQLMVNGETETRDVEIGAQGSSMTEITSGLSEGDNIVYEFEMSGMQGGGQGGQMGSPPAGTESQPDAQSTEI